MTIKISQQFDAGAIEVVRADNRRAIDLNIRKDSHADIAQWFYFRLQGARGEACTIRFLNAGEAAYAGRLERLPGRGQLRPRQLVPRADQLSTASVMTIDHTPELRQRLLRVFRALFLGTPPASCWARAADVRRARARPGQHRRRAAT